MADEESISFDLEERLKEDQDGSRKAAILEELSSTQRAVKRRLDDGVAPGEYEKLTRMHAALEAAKQTVEAAAKHFARQK